MREDMICLREDPDMFKPQSVPFGVGNPRPGLGNTHAWGPWYGPHGFLRYGELNKCD